MQTEEPTTRAEGPMRHLKGLSSPFSRFIFRTDEAGVFNPLSLIALVLFTWLPLVVLTAVSGRLVSDAVAVPLLADLEVHIRFLLALPLLLYAESLANQRIHTLLPQFIERGLIPDGDLGRFDQAVSSAMRLRRSGIAEIAILAFIYLVGVLVIWRHFVAPEATTWFFDGGGDTAELSLAGNWYAYISLPIFQFVLVRWYFHLFVWARLLWQISRIDLRLIPTHPDRVGGLGFLSVISAAFSTLAVAHGALLAGWLATRCVILGVPLPDFKFEIGAVVVFVLLLTLAPLLLFAGQLRKAKRRGMLEYGYLAMGYVRAFDSKWLREAGARPADSLGSADIQSLADLANSFDVVRGMNVTPITQQTILSIAIGTLAPGLPLVLTMVPINELMKGLAGIIL